MNETSTLSKILKGINTTLNIANKAMPIYKEAKPILNTIKNTYSNLKNNKNDINKMIKLLKLKNQLKQDTKINNIIKTQNNKTINNPNFFI